MKSKIQQLEERKKKLELANEDLQLKIRWNWNELQNVNEAIEKEHQSLVLECGSEHQ